MIKNKRVLSLDLKDSIEGADLKERGVLFHSLGGCNSKGAVTHGSKLRSGDSHIGQNHNITSKIKHFLTFV